MNRFKSEGFLDGAAFGAFVAVEITIILVWVFAEVDEAFSDNILTLAASAFTLFAAFIALGGSFRVVRSSGDIAASEKKAKLESARAALPLVVSALYEVCENRTQYLIDGDSARKGNSWNLEASTIQTIRECIEASQGSPHEVLKELISVYQICMARFRDVEVSGHLSEKNIDKWEKYDRARAIIDWVTLQALCESMFDFSRSRSDEVDRLSVPSRARKFIHFLHDSRGWVVTNDGTVKELFDGALSNDHFAFAHPDWKLH